MKKIHFLLLAIMGSLLVGAGLEAGAPPKRVAQKVETQTSGVNFRSTVFADQVRSDTELLGDVDGFPFEAVSNSLPEAMDAIQQQLAGQMALLGLVPVSRQEVAQCKRTAAGNPNPLLLVMNDEIVFKPKDIAALEAILQKISFIGDRSRGEMSGKVHGIIVIFKLSDPTYLNGMVKATLDTGIKGIVTAGYGDERKFITHLSGPEMNSHDLRALAAAVAQGETPENALVDANERLKLPAFFDGVVLSDGKNVAFTFHGEWRQSPTIAGATAAIYSKKAAALQNVFTDGGSGILKLGLNLGMKRGVPRFRAFLWPGENRAANVVDEGLVTQDGTSFKLVGKKYTVILRGRSGVWAPSAVTLARFEGAGFRFANGLRQGKPYGRDNEYMPSQHAPEWAVGSSLFVTDGFLGKFYFRLFDGKTTVVLPTITLDRKTLTGPPAYLGVGGHVEEEFRGLFSRGMIFYSSPIRGLATISSMDLEYAPDFALTGVNFGKEEGVLDGRSVSVALGEAETKALLDAAKSNRGLLQVLPSTMNKAFAGCVFYAPHPVFYPDFQETPAGEVANAQTIEGYRDAATRWRQAIEGVGGKLVLVEQSAWGNAPSALYGVGRVEAPR